VRHGLRPVAAEGHRAEQRAPQAGQLIRLKEGHRGGDGDQDHGERGQEPACPACPEATQVEPFHPPAPAGLSDKKVGNQVAGQDEEHVDAEKPAGHPGEALVKGHDGQHRKRAHAVQAAQPRPAARAFGRARARHCGHA